MRRQVISEQKALGRRALAVLPIHYPKPLLTAMDTLAVELWGPPGAPRGPQAGRLQTYVCALVRNALAFVAGGGADEVDGFLFPHTCDSIQGLATLLPDFGGAGDRPALRFFPPRGDLRPSMRRYLRAEIGRLAEDLARVTGKALEEERLRDALVLHHRIDAARARLLDERARLPLDDAALYRILRRGEYLWPEDHLRELEEAQESISDGIEQRGVGLLVSGIAPEPQALLEQLAECGAYIAADDYAAVGRRVVRAPLSTGEEPLDTLTGWMLAAPPCSTRAASLDARLAHLDRIARIGGAAGVVIHAVKFCEPELFDAAAIKSHFAARDVPVLVIESELEAELSGQSITRLEAFVEMVSLRPAPAAEAAQAGRTS